MPGDANLGRAVLEISTKDVNLSKGLAKSEADVKAALARMEANFQKFGQSMGKSLDDGASKSSASISKLSTAATKGAGGLKTLETAATSNSNSLKNTVTSAAQAEAKLASMTTQSGKAALGFTGLNSGLASIVSPLGLATTGFVGLGVASLKTAGDFEASMANLQVMTGITDTSSAAFKELEKTAISVGESTTFSSQEAADGMAELAAAGLNTKDVITAIGPVAKVAEINHVSMAEAAKTATVAMNSFGLASGDVSKIMDIQTKASNLGVLKFQDFQQALAAVGSVAKLSNQDLTGVTSALIALTNNGQSASDAGTSIKSALMSLTNPSAEAADAMQKLGLNVYNAEGKMIPFADIVAQIEKNTKGMTDAQRNQLLATLAGSDGIRAFSGAMGASITVQQNGRDVTLKGSDALKEYQKQLDNSAGSADKAAQIIHSTFNAKLEETMGKVEELSRKIGEKLLPLAKQLLDTFDQKVDDPLGMNQFKSKTGKDDFLTTVLGWVGGIDRVKSASEALQDVMSKVATETVKAAIVNQGVSQTVEIHRRKLQEFNQEIDNSSAAYKKANPDLVQFWTASTIAAKSSEYHRQVLYNLNEEIDRSGMAYQDTGKYVLKYSELTQQAWQSSEFQRKKMQSLNEEIDRNGLSIYRLSPPMQTIYDKSNALAGKIITLEGAISNLSKANDELSGKISASNQIISVMDMGVDQLALKHQGAKVAFDGTNHSLGEGYDQWKKYTEIQAAGGEGSVQAGVKAGELAKQLVKVDGAFQPLLDTTYNAINANNKNKDSLVANTEAAAKLELGLDPLTAAARKLDNAVEEGAEKTRGHANALNIFKGSADKAAESTSNANKRLGEYNSTTVPEKDAKTNFGQVVKDLDAALLKLSIWAGTQIATKTLNVVTNFLGLTPPSGGGGGGTAPAPTPQQRPSQGQSTGLSGAMDFGGAGARLSGTFAQATVQATQAAFSLTGLQSQIDAIVKMFNSMDAKALKAAGDQAESVSKIAGAASSMVDAMAKVQTYTGTSKDLMKLVSDDSATMTGMYIAGAKQFNQKQLEGAALYVDTSGKVAGAASSMFDALSKLPKYSGPSRDNIRDFTGNVKDLTFDFWDYSQVFTKDMLEAAGSYADTAGKVADTTGKAADALLKLKDWPPIFRGSISGFVGNLKDATFDFSEVTIFSEDQYKTAVTFAENSGKVADTIGKGAEALAKLLDWPPIFRGSISGFTGNLKDAVADFDDAGKNFDETMYTRATSFAETAGKVGAAIGQGVAGLAALADYKGAIRSQITLFAGDLDATVDAFQTFAIKYQTDGLKAAGLYAETAGKIVGVIKPGVEGFNGLAEYKGLAAGKLKLFETDLDTLLQNFTNTAKTYEPKAMAAGSAWAESVGKIAGGLNDSAQLFTSLQEYKSIPSKTITLFINDIELTVQLAGKMAQRAEGPLLDQLKLFTTATGGLFTELSSAMGLFKSLENYKSVPVAVMKDFVWQIEETINLAYALAQKTDKDLLAKATDFAVAVDKIFSKINTAVTTFKGLQELKNDPKNTIDVLIAAIDEAIRKMPQANSQAQDFYNVIDQWAKKLEDAAKRAADGLNASNIAIGIATTPLPKGDDGSGGSTPLDNWQPSVSAATQALSSSSSTPLLNSGLSMPAPIVSNSSSQSSGDVIVQASFPNVTTAFNRAQLAQIGEEIDKRLHQQGNKIR